MEPMVTRVKKTRKEHRVLGYELLVIYPLTLLSYEKVKKIEIIDRCLLKHTIHDVSDSIFLTQIVK